VAAAAAAVAALMHAADGAIIVWHALHAHAFMVDSCAAALRALAGGCSEGVAAACGWLHVSAPPDWAPMWLHLLLLVIMR
jgi:hypothetical protein